MTRRARQLSVCLSLAILAMAAGRVAVAAESKPLADLVPEGTLLYVGWPGSDLFGEVAKDTELSKLFNEPELVRLRTEWSEQILPAIDDLIIEEIGNEQEAAIYKSVRELITRLWRYPTSIGLVGVGLSEMGPQIDVVVMVRAGAEAAELSKTVEGIVSQAAGVDLTGAMEVPVGGATLKKFPMPFLPIHWGVIGDDFMLALGNKTVGFLSGEAPGKPLGGSARFATAMKTTSGGPNVPVLFMDIQSMVASVKQFQPMLANFNVPILGEEGGMDRLLAECDLQTAESLSVAMVPEAGGFKTTAFLHAPGIGSKPGSMLKRKPLSEADLKILPADANFASVSRFDWLGMYQMFLKLVSVLDTDVHESIVSAITMAEEMTDIRIEQDVFGSLGETTAIFDAPSQGGFWFTGITGMIEVKPGHRLNEALLKLVEAISAEVEPDLRLSVQTEAYRGLDLHYMVSAGPIPVAPAWAEYEGRMIVALYPQMVRATLDRLLDKGPSLLDNPDFVRGRKLMPEGACAIEYVDTRKGVRQLYRIALPVSQALLGLLRSEGIPVDVGMLPSLQTCTKHLFGNVAASAITDQGVLTVYHGALPIGIPDIGEGGMVLPLVASVALPSLARARSMARRTVSLANLKGIGTAVYTYAVEHDDQFPPDLQTLIDNGSISPQALISPLDSSHDEGTVSYIYIPGQGSDVDQRNVIAYEKPENYDGEGTAVLFADSHAEFVNMWRFEELLRETGERLGRDLSATLSGPVVTQPSATRQKAQLDMAQAAVAHGGTISTQIELFHVQVGCYPVHLKELMEAPAQEADAEKWAGPYIRPGARALTDPWGNPLQYLQPGRHHPDKYDLWSAGPDGESGTDDDIGNWQ